MVKTKNIREGSKKIRVVHFVEALSKGGLENVIFNIATGLDPEVFDVRVVCRIAGGYTADRLCRLGVKVEILNKRRINPWRLKRILSSFRNGEHSILHCHGLFASSSEALMGRLSGYDSVFVHVHSFEKPHLAFQRAKLLVARKVVNRYIAVSKSVQECLNANHIENVSVIANAIDTDRFLFVEQPVKTISGLPKDKFVIGMVGRIVKGKGFKCFMDLIRHNSDIFGLIVGEGSYEAGLKTQIKSQNISDRVLFLPFKSQKELPEIYANLDAQFLFSEREGLPLSLLEAQAVGVPYIGNIVGGIGEVVKDNYNGLIIEKFNLREIYDRIKYLKERYEIFRKNARMVIEKNYSLRNMIKKFEILYLNSLSSQNN